MLRGSQPEFRDVVTNSPEMTKILQNRFYLGTVRLGQQGLFIQQLAGMSRTGPSNDVMLSACDFSDGAPHLPQLADVGLGHQSNYPRSDAASTPAGTPANTSTC